MRSASTLLFASVFAVCGPLGCGASRPYLGDIKLRAYADTGGSPTTFGVEAGRIVDGDVDVAIDPDGCARGRSSDADYQLCPRELPAHPGARGEAAWRWLDQGGDFVTRVSPDGARLRVDGTLRGPHGVDRELHVTLRFGKGPQWDELRRHPALYAIAAASIGMRGEPPAGDSAMPQQQP